MQSLVILQILLVISFYSIIFITHFMNIEQYSRWHNDKKLWSEQSLATEYTWRSRRWRRHSAADPHTGEQYSRSTIKYFFYGKLHVTNIYLTGCNRYFWRFFFHFVLFIKLHGFKSWHNLDFYCKKSQFNLQLIL